MARVIIVEPDISKEENERNLKEVIEALEAITQGECTIEHI
ncbi:hypothetical protein [Clostridium sp. 001]|nr:hypothetical protein [Clostridium sp. 001]